MLSIFCPRRAVDFLQSDWNKNVICALEQYYAEAAASLTLDVFDVEFSTLKNAQKAFRTLHITLDADSIGFVAHLRTG